MQVEVYQQDDENAPWLTLEFESIPRIGEYLSLDAGGYFKYYDIKEVWYRQIDGGAMRACVRVNLDD